MNKKTLKKTEVQKLVKATQRLEGYKSASKQVVKQAEKLRKQYAIKVSIR